MSSALSQVSQAAAELQQYCMQNACKDALLLGVPAGSNPFREPRSCALLWRPGRSSLGKHMVMGDCHHVPRKRFSTAKSLSLLPCPRAKFYRNLFVLTSLQNFLSCIPSLTEPVMVCLGYRHVLLTRCLQFRKETFIFKNWVFVIFLTFLYSNKICS